jgi:hypothetical protein
MFARTSSKDEGRVIAAIPCVSKQGTKCGELQGTLQALARTHGSVLVRPADRAISA